MFRKTSPICHCHLHSWKKCWKVPIRVLALMLPPWIVKSKKIQNISKIIWWQRMANVLSACQVSLGNNIRGCRGKKNNQHSKIDFFLPRLPRMLFPNETWQALRTLVVLCHHIFLNFFRVYYSWWYQKS